MDCELRTAEGIIFTLGRSGFQTIGLCYKVNFPAKRSKYLKKAVLSPELGVSFVVYLEFLMNLPFRGVIIPSTDLSVMFLSRYQNELKEAGFLLSVPELNVLEEVFDKASCNIICGEIGIPAAKTFLVASAEDVLLRIKDISWPVIVKPTRLAGGGYIRAESEAELVAAYKTQEKIINHPSTKSHQSQIVIQQWIESTMTDNWSCDVFYDKNGKIQDYVTAQRLRTSLNSNGTPTSRFLAGELINNEILLANTRKILEYKNWVGFAHVEFIYSKSTGEYILTEVNPRLPGYSFMHSMSGHEQAVYYASDLFGISYEPAGLLEGVTYFQTLRYPGDITEGFINIHRGFITPCSLFGSYYKAFRSDSKVIIDHFNKHDLRMTISIFTNSIVEFISKTFKFIAKKTKALLMRSSCRKIL
jgi:Carbamoyl-phosphate synthase L chain, ATP binding domain